MLGNSLLAVRLAGGYALKRLASEHPKEHHVQVMELFCAFVRNPTHERGVRGLESTRVRGLSGSAVTGGRAGHYDHTGPPRRSGVGNRKGADVPVGPARAYLPRTVPQTFHL